MCKLHVPLIAVVTGEGGSGGALAIGVGDKMLMLENSIYSVASPEASAAILWRDAVHAPAAAEAMKITAQDLYEHGIVDEIVSEPEGGAHTDPPALMDTLRARLALILAELDERYINKGESGIEAMLSARYNKYRQIGRWEEITISNLAPVN
jgi:acetyl-CoA carboxylase carboxyl transferase subunit alpha